MKHPLTLSPLLVLPGKGQHHRGCDRPGHNQLEHRLSGFQPPRCHLLYASRHPLHHTCAHSCHGCCEFTLLWKDFFSERFRNLNCAITSHFKLKGIIICCCATKRPVSAVIRDGVLKVLFTQRHLREMFQMSCDLQSFLSLIRLCCFRCHL